MRIMIALLTIVASCLAIAGLAWSARSDVLAESEG